MNKKCQGCGVILQDNNILLEGFTTSLSNHLCRRCFRMRNYGEYQIITKSNEEYIDILKSIGSTKSLVLYVVDVLNVPKDLTVVLDYLKNNDVLLVLNKRDVLPLSLLDEKIIKYFEELNLKFIDYILISAEKNYNFDKLYKLINKYRTTKNVYVVGDTNAGKSSIINRFMKDYVSDDDCLTISPMPSTTLNEVKLKVNDFYLIDTPGLVDKGNIVNYISTEMLHKISPKKEIKPKVFQIKKGHALLIEDMIRIDYVEGEKNVFVIYMSNELNIKKINATKHNYLKDLYNEEIELKYYEDIVVNGLGFIRNVYSGRVVIYHNKDVEVFKRKSMV